MHRVTDDELRARWVFAGRHLWTVTFHYAVADPAAPPGVVILSPETLIAIDDVHCRWCGQRYAEVADPEVCPGPVTGAG